MSASSTITPIPSLTHTNNSQLTHSKRTPPAPYTTPATTTTITTHLRITLTRNLWIIVLKNHFLVLEKRLSINGHSPIRISAIIVSLIQEIKKVINIKTILALWYRHQIKIIPHISLPLYFLTLPSCLICINSYKKMSTSERNCFNS